MALPLDVTGWTEAEVLEVFAAAKEAITSGSKVISWSSAGSSVSRLASDSPSETMRWCQWALRQLNPAIYGYNRPRTRAVFSNNQLDQQFTKFT